MSKYLVEHVWLFDKQHSLDTVPKGNLEVSELCIKMLEYKSHKIKVSIIR